MKVGFFLLRPPFSSETFVLNQVIASIDMGCDVGIVTLQKGNLEDTYASSNTYRLGEKTRWSFNEPESKLAKLKYRTVMALHGLTRAATWKMFNVARYGEETHNLILAAVCGGSPQAFQADAFITHFGPADVTAVKLRELGMIRGEIAAVSHDIDALHRGVLTHYTPEYQQLF